MKKKIPIVAAAIVLVASLISMIAPTPPALAAAPLNTTSWLELTNLRAQTFTANTTNTLTGSTFSLQRSSPTTIEVCGYGTAAGTGSGTMLVALSRDGSVWTTQTISGAVSFSGTSVVRGYFTIAAGTYGGPAYSYAKPLKFVNDLTNSLTISNAWYGHFN